MPEVDQSAVRMDELYPSQAEIKAAGKAINSLMVGLKNYSVFPSDHSSTAKMLEGVYQSLVKFTDKYGNLSFEVSKKGLLYEEKVIFESVASDENPAYILYRDGIRWFEFTEGILNDELVTLFKLFNHYRVVPDEPEDDLVTALWRADLSHILYEASYDLWDTDPTTELSLMQPADPEPHEEKETRPRPGGDDWESIRPSNDKDFQTVDFELKDDQGKSVWKLTDDEQKKIEAMVQEEIDLDSSEVTTRLMFFVLKEEEEAHIFESIVQYLHEEVVNFISKKNFLMVDYILDNMKSLQEEEHVLKKPRSWAIPVFQKFRSDIARPDVLNTLIPIWPSLPTTGPENLRAFVGFLQLLPTSSAVILAQMLDKISTKNVRSLVIEMIASFAANDHGALMQLLENENEDLLLRMVRVVKDLADEEKSAEILKSIMHHENAKVRSEAMKNLGRRDFF